MFINEWGCRMWQADLYGNNRSSLFVFLPPPFITERAPTWREPLLNHPGHLWEQLQDFLCASECGTYLHCLWQCLLEHLQLFAGLPEGASAWASERVFKICGCLYCTGVFRRLSPGCKIVYLQESLWQHLHDCHINDLSRASSCNPPEDEVSKEEEVNTWDKVYAPAETSDLGAESNRQDMGLNLLIHSLSRLLLVSLILILCFFDSLQFMFEFVTWVNGICIAFSLAPSLRLWPKLFSFFLYSHFLSLSAWPGISFSSRVVGLDDLRMQRDIVSLAFDWLSTYHQRAALIGWTKMHSTVASIRGGKWHERSRDLSLEQGESVNAVTHFHSTQVAPPADSPLLLLD